MAVFRDVLERIRNRVEGTLAVSLIGLDGIAIETVDDGSVPTESMGAEFGGFVKSIRLSNTELSTGDVEQFSLVTEKYITFLSAVTTEYFVLLILNRSGNYGRARFELLRARDELKAELS